MQELGNVSSVPSIGIRVGDHVRWKGANNIYLVVDYPRGTPAWMKRDAVWIKALRTLEYTLYFGEEKPMGKNRTNFERVCNNCMKLPEEHVNGHCLFATTTWR